MATWKLGPYSTSNSYIKYHIQIVETGQSIADNTTTLSVSVNFYRTNSGYETYGSGTLYCKIFDTWYEQSVTPQQKITLGGIDLFQKFVTVPHTATGERDCWVGAYLSHDVVSSEHQGGYVSLTTIPRNSSFTVGSGTLGTAQTITINRKSDSFTHTLTYKCGSASGTIATKTTATSVSWAPPLSLAAQNTTGTSVPIAITMTAYSGTTVIGTSSANITCAIPASVAPTCSFTLEDITGVDDIYGSPVQGLSKIKIVVTAKTAQGSPIKSYSISANGATYTTATATTGELQQSGNSPVNVTVRDARGRTGSASYTMKVQEYTGPVVSSLAVHRCNANGTENPQGEYVRVTFSAAISPLSNKNTASYQLRYKRTAASAYTTVDLTDLDGQYTVTGYEYILAASSSYSFDIEVIAADSHRTTIRSTSASTGFTIMNLNPSGDAVAFGKVSEIENAVEFGIDAHFTGAHVQRGNRYSFSSPGEAGIEGFVHMAQITITAANADTPITFVLTSRQRVSPMTVYVSLRNSTMDASSLSSIRYEGTNYGAFLVQSANLVWDLYVQKSSNYDTITIQDWYTSKTMESRMRLTFPGALVSTVPTPYHRATPVPNQSLLDYIYPVGSVYISYSHVNPGELFGGTWARIENAFLWATTASGTIGQTGGEQEVTLTTEELPAHSHGSVYSQHATGTKQYAWYTASGSAVAYGAVSTGGGQAHNNMPPYIQVSVWRRTA